MGVRNPGPRRSNTRFGCRFLRIKRLRVTGKIALATPNASTTQQHPPVLLLFGALFDILDHVSDCLQLFGVFVRDFDRKFFFKCHHQFDDIQRVRAQILNERGLWRNLLGVNAQLLDNDVFNFLFDLFFRHKNLFGLCWCAWKSLKHFRAQHGK